MRRKERASAIGALPPKRRAPGRPSPALREARVISSLPPWAAYQPPACVDNLECNRLHELGNTWESGKGGSRAPTEKVVMKLRLGIIGAGLKAAEYARGWTAMPDVEIAALAEIDPASRQRLSDICAAGGRVRPAEYISDKAMLE